MAFRAKIRWQRSPRNSFSFDKCPVSVWHDERSLVVAFSIYSCIGLAQVLCAGWRRAARPGGYTYYVINPRPPPLACRSPGPPSRGSSRARRTRTGFPRPRASRPLTTHGAPRSAAASRAATRADVALYSRLVCDYDLMISFMLISGR